MNKAKVAAAVAAGYALGRMRKGRWALGLMGLVAGKRLSADPAQLVGGLLESSPQLKELTDGIRGNLASAGRKAAVAAAGRQIETLTDRLQSRTMELRDATAHRGEDEDDRADAADTDADVDADEGEGEDDTKAKPRRSRAASESSGRSGKRAASPPKEKAQKAPARRSTTSRAASAKGTAKTAAKKTTSTARKATGTRRGSTRTHG